MDIALPLRRARPLLIAAGVLLLAALAAGYRLYAGQLIAHSDDMTTYGIHPWPTPLSLIHDCYTALNGRLANFVTYAVLRLLLNPHHIHPDAYPWWLVISLSHFLALASVLLLAAVIRRTTDLPPAWIAAIAAVTLIAWGLSSQLYETVLYAVCIGFTAGLFVLSAALAVAARRMSAAAAGAVALAYVFASLSSEQMLTSTPILFTAVTMVLLLRSSLTARQATLRTAGWIALSALSAAIYFRSPGQRKRNPMVGVASHGVGDLIRDFPRWYAYSVREIYAAVFGSDRGAVVIHTLLLATIAVLLAAAWLRRREEALVPALAAGFALAFHASMAHLLFAPYFPGGRVRYYPALLLLLTMALAVCAALRLFVARAAVARAAAVVALAAATVIAVRHFPLVAEQYRVERWNSIIRLDVRQRMVELCRTTPHRKFRLTGCPIFTDNTWGWEAYLAWRGYPGATVVPIGMSTEFNPVGDEWVPVGCRVPPLLPPPTLAHETYTPTAVRNILYPAASPVQFGAWDSDFWVPPTVTECHAVGAYNPNSAGGSYKETFDYRILFGLGLSPDGTQSMVLLSPQLAGGVRFWPDRTAVYWVYGGKLLRAAPEKAFHDPDWNRRPYLRIAQSQVIIGRFGWYSDVRLTCR
jgi:hypothetical protein